MSDLPRVGLVAEGPTDFVILVAALDAILGEVVPRFFQPPGDRIDATTVGGAAGTYGGGWKGVRAWCRDARANGQWDEAVTGNQAVVVHVDADIAGDPEIDVERPCPPAVDTVDALRPVVAAWIGPPLDARCVFCIPSKASDAWLVAALKLAGPEVEHDPNPAANLRGVGGRPKAVTGAKPDKHAAGYRRLASHVREQWAHVTTTCTQAARFEAELTAAAAVQDAPARIDEQPAVRKP